MTMKSNLKSKLSCRETRFDHLLILILLFAISLGSQHIMAQSDHGNSNGAILSARWGHVMAYDPVRDEILLFGGAPMRTEMLDDTWEWDGSKWQKLHVSGPTPRAYAAMAFDGFVRRAHSRWRRFYRLWRHVGLERREVARGNKR
jgi:hypothetical protein